MTARRTGRALVYAVTFLTVVPLRVADDARARAAAPAFHALVGALIGLAGGGVLAALEPAVGPLAASILAVVAMTVLTGGLHQDGLADCADGLGVRGDRDRRLQVMRDPVVGSFGALALAFWALLLTTSLAQLPTGDAVGALVAAGAISRWAALLHAGFAPPARTDGLGSSFVPGAGAIVAAGVTALVAAGLATGADAGPALAAGVLTAVATSALARRAIGGRTGDTLGATVVLAETVVVLVLLALV